MTRIILSPRARRDIREVLAYTRERWGTRKARDYAELTRRALVALARDPERGKLRDDIRPGILAFHLARPARHVLFYRLDATGNVQVIRFLHDAMDFARHVP